MATAKPTVLLQQAQEHTIELMCRICAVDFKIATEGVPIFSTEQLMDKIKNYLHIQVNNLDKLSHLVCNECVRKIENFHCYALMAQKNQELFNIMYSEKIYREHCTALSSLNTTLYREPPPAPQIQVPKKPQPAVTVHPTGPASPVKKPKMQQNQQTKQTKPKVQIPQTVVSPTLPVPQAQQVQQALQQQQQQQQQPVAVLSTEDITIFTYQDLKLGQVIKDQELLKLILRALKWNDVGKTIEFQLDRLKNTSFRAVLNSPELLRDEDLVQLLGPYMDHGSFNSLDTSKSSGIDYSAKLMDQNTVTEMEVGVDPELFFPYDDDEPKSMEQIEVTKVVKPKKERKKSEPRTKAANKKVTSALPCSSSTSTTTITAVPSVSSTASTGKIRVKSETQLFKSASISSVSNTRPLIIIPTPKSKLKSAAAVAEVPLTVKKVPEKDKSKSATKKASTEVVQIDQQTPQSTSSPSTSKKVEPELPQSTQPEVESTVSESITTTMPQQEEPVTSTSTNSPAVEKPKDDVEMVEEPIESPKPSTTPAAKPTPKPRQQRKVKAEQVGPKTRARSVFNAKHKCAVCNKKFATSGNLKAHVKTHKPKGKFNCDKCGRIFKSQSNLTRHKEYHAGERYSCRTCGRVYPSNSTLKQHEIAHSNFRPHKCNICLKTFKRNQDLKFHTNQHTGLKPYQCPFCPRAFASSGNCFSHRKRVHSDKTTPPPPPTSSKRLSAVDSTYNKKLIKA